MTEGIEAKRARLAAIERELAGLGARYDLAMSAFKFDEARQVQQEIAEIERERAELVEAFPAAVPHPGPKPVPITIGSWRARRRRR